LLDPLNGPERNGRLSKNPAQKKLYPALLESQVH